MRREIEIPVYLFTGFLDAGKTRFIRETLEGDAFDNRYRILLLMCEQGEEELDLTKFSSDNVFVENIDSMDEIEEFNLGKMAAKYRPNVVIVEFNGMWMLSDFIARIPRNWVIAQNFMFAEAESFINYNDNMRSLMVDKLKIAELVVLNRSSETTDKERIHKIIRGTTRRAQIAFEYEDGRVENDETVDPLPFDINAPIIEIEDEDYALWYRDIAEEMEKYEGKTVRFKAVCAKTLSLEKDVFIAGRHVMTCCVQDIQYSALVCKWDKATTVKNRQWLTVTAKIYIKFNKIYGKKGPVLAVISAEPAEKPEQEVASFY